LTVYFDTSALLKLVIEEDGSATAAALWDAADAVATSRLAYAEGRAALAAARRIGRLTRPDLGAAKREFEALWRQLRLLEPGEDIVRAAGGLAEQLALRAYDAIHLASAVSASGGDFVLATWDRDLGSAALALGLAVSPPSPD
jgi:predicted nucleic acid-binding protein